jgi:hypothetical protein
MARWVILLSLVSFLSLSLGALGQEPKGEASGMGGSQAVLPLSKVVLYSSGVGYFQHDSAVHGRTRVELRFKTESINDLLKSLVVQDFGGGTVSSVLYASRDPLTKTLRSFGIDLTTNPSLGQLLDQIRGERIEVAAPNPLTGVILGVERKKEAVGHDKQDTVMVEYLNVVTQEGLRSIPLHQAQKIRLLNDQLQQELQQALAVLAGAHDTQKKKVSIAFDGEGTRNVRVAYIMETPVWKTSYRLVLDDQRPPFLQGWAIVENTTDTDWTNVGLSLVSGRPISFVMDLYQPLYATRPVVVPELYSSLRAQTYGEAVEEQAAGDVKKEGAGGASQEGRIATMRKSFAGGAPASPEALESKARMDLRQGITPTTQARETGELFEYAITAPLTLGRQTSAMIPILSRDIDAQKLSIYNQQVHAKYPLNGLRLKNTTPLHLMQGPITVFDGGAYAGDARIEDVVPGQDRLISYAMDLKTEVEPVAEAGQQDLVTVSIRKGTLLATRKLVEEKTYNVRNRDQKKKVVLIEHPFRPDWKLAAPAEPLERTRDVYRFAVLVEAGRGASLRVREENQIQQSVRLMDSGSDQIAYYLQAKEISPKVREALQRVSGLRDRLSQTSSRRSLIEQRIREITQEQARIRENMGKLAQNSDLYVRYVKKLDQQETEVEKNRKEIEALQSAEEALKRELNDYLMNLDLD